MRPSVFDPSKLKRSQISTGRENVNVKIAAKHVARVATTKWSGEPNKIAHELHGLAKDAQRVHKIDSSFFQQLLLTAIAVLGSGPDAQFNDDQVKHLSQKVVQQMTEATIRQYVHDVLSEHDAYHDQDELVAYFDELVLNPLAINSMEDDDIVDLLADIRSIKQRWIKQNPEEPYALHLAAEAEKLLRDSMEDINIRRMWLRRPLELDEYE